MLAAETSNFSPFGCYPCTAEELPANILRRIVSNPS
jgi:hypothetical protein